MISITNLLSNGKLKTDSLRYSQERNISVLVLNVTNLCNLTCIHCYNSSIQNSAYNQRLATNSGNLTTDEIKLLIDDLSSLGAKVILFSGGEPLIRKDIFELGGYAFDKGIRPVLSTNGTLITKTVAKKIKKSNFQYVGISIDGTPATHNYFRGEKNAFEKSLKGLKLSQDEGLKTGIRFTITKINYKEIPSILDLVIKENIPRICFYHLVYSGRGSDLINEDISNKERKQTINTIIKKAEEMIKFNYPVEILTVDNPCDGVYLYLTIRKNDVKKAKKIYNLLKQSQGKSSGEKIGCVDCFGYVHPDQFWTHYSLGNIRSRKFSEIWNDNSDKILFGLRNKIKMLKGKCKVCKFFEICGGGFRVRAEAVYNDIWADEPNCYIADKEKLP